LTNRIAPPTVLRTPGGPTPEKEAQLMSSVSQSPKRAVLYARVSTEAQATDDKTSLAQQIAALEAYAASQGHEIVARVAVQEPTDTIDRDARPGLDEVWRMADSGGADVVLAQDSDRIVREPYLRGYLNLRFAEHGTKLRALDDAEDGSEYADIINFLKGTQAKAERPKFAERSQRNKLHDAREGKVITVPPYGFRKDGYRAVVVPEKMAIVRRMFALVASEGTMHAAKSAFEGEGIYTPGGVSKVWRVTTIRNMIENDAYKPHTREELERMVEKGQLAKGVLEDLDLKRPCGVLWYNTHRIVKKAGRRIDQGLKPEGEHVAVPVPDAGVPLEDVIKARRAVSDNVRTVSKGRYPHDLRGLLFCECGRRMATHPTTNRHGREYFYYVCPRGCARRKHHDACELDERVSRFVESLLRSNVLAEQLEAQIESERKRLRDPSREIEGHLKQIGRIDKKMDYFLDLAAEEGWPKEALRVKLDGLREQRKVAQAEVEHLRAGTDELARFEEIAEYARNYYASDLADDMHPLRSVRESVPVPNPERQRKVGRLTVETVGPGSSRKRTPEEMDALRREALRERSEHRRKVYRDLDLSAVVDGDGNLTVRWFGGVCSKTLSRAWRRS
jgi:DNA invertase Pin-like site-specific DNA recombinase